MIITQLRRYHRDKTTSRLLVNGKPYSKEVIEDVGRPANVKIPEHTCIPEGTYKVLINYSPTFKVPLMLLYNKSDHSVDRDGVRFTGIRCHGGVNTDHTAGCILEPTYRILQAKVQEALDAGEEVLWTVTQEVD